MSNHIYYTTEQMRHDLHTIVRQAAFEGFKPDVIVGLARGGLQPALMLSHYYDAALVTLNVSLRDNKVDHGHDSLDTLKSDVMLGKQILIVDDICDSGKTLRVVWDSMGLAQKGSPDEILNEMAGLGQVRSAVLWNNPGQDVFDPDYVGREINRHEDERWIIFPFEDWWTR